MNKLASHLQKSHGVKTPTATIMNYARKNMRR